MNNPTSRQAKADVTIANVGGETLTGSGFETEIPDSDFADAEASKESAGQ